MLLFFFVHNNHYHFFEQISSTLEYIEVTIRDRIKTPRINCTSHWRKFAEELENEKRIEENDEAPAFAFATGRQANDQTIKRFNELTWRSRLPKVRDPPNCSHA